MKKVCFVIAVLLTLQTLVYGQEKTKMHSSGYGAVSSNYSKLNDQNAFFLGGYGGWMINHRLMIGVGGYGLINHIDGAGINPENNKKNKLGMGYGGLMVEYTFFDDMKIHITTNMLLGGGVITNGDISQDEESGDDHWQHQHMAGYYVVQPSANLEMDATNWLRISVGAGYRLIAGSNLNGISNNNLSGTTANFSLKFGAF